MDMTLLRNSLGASDAALSTKLQHFSTVVNGAIRVNREVVEALRPSLLDNVGLFAALNWRLIGLCRDADIPLQTHLPDQEFSVESALALHLFRLTEDGVLMLLAIAQPVTSLTVRGSHSDGTILISIQVVGESGAELQRRASTRLLAARADIIKAQLSFTTPPEGGALMAIALRVQG